MKYAKHSTHYHALSLFSVFSAEEALLLLLRHVFALAVNTHCCLLGSASATEVLFSSAAAAWRNIE